jgi:signal transduction histidine kinase/ActR/RegA family two-component response regulator
MPDQDPCDDALRLLQRRLERERTARRQAEALIERKSLELFEASMQLRSAHAALEVRVAERTAALEQANARLAREAADRTLLLRMAQLAADTESVTEALGRALQTICEHISWPAAHVWIVDACSDDRLLPSGIWYLAAPERCRGLCEAVAALVCPRGNGLPGRILAAGRPEWVADVAADPDIPYRTEMAAAGLHAAFGAPVRVRNRTVAVLEFLAGSPAVRDDRLLALMADIGVQLGRVIERREAEQQLDAAREQAEAASRAKSEFLANMSHEIRTPMTAILGYADVLAETCTDASSREAVDVIRRNGDHLLTIINDILDLSKVEAGRMEIERVAVSPATLVREIVDLMTVRCEAKGLRLDVQWAGAVPESIPTDPTRVKQILINLVGNAIKFTELGSVRLQVAFEPGDAPQLVFDVIDTGVGIPPDRVPRLFQPFAQADSATTRTFGGTGLGLAVSARLARLLGGEVRLVASQPGQGTHFRVSLPTGPLAGVPLVEAAGAATPVARPQTTSTAAPLRCRILLAEDGRDNQRLIAHVLRKAGAEVEIVGDGQAAIDAAWRAAQAAAPFDVLLTDIQMPLADGYEVARTLRARGYQGRIIALTAHAMAADRERCLAAGCDDYDSKPIDRARLLGVIRRNLPAGTG